MDTKTDTPPFEPAASSATPVNNDKLKTITLDEPVIRGETQIETLVLRQPVAGDYRGLGSVGQIMGGDADALLKLIPRISNPPLTEPEVAALCPADFGEVTFAVTSFFMRKEQRKAWDEEVAKARSMS